MPSRSGVECYVRWCQMERQEPRAADEAVVLDGPRPELPERGDRGSSREGPRGAERGRGEAAAMLLLLMML